MTIERAIAARYGAAAAALGVSRAALRRWIAAHGFAVKTTRLCWLVKEGARV